MTVDHGFLNLPADVVRLVVDRLGVSAFGTLGAVCRSAYNFVLRHDYGESSMCTRHDLTAQNYSSPICLVSRIAADTRKDLASFYFSCETCDLGREIPNQNIFLRKFSSKGINETNDSHVHSMIIHSPVSRHLPSENLPLVLEASGLSLPSDHDGISSLLDISRFLVCILGFSNLRILGLSGVSMNQDGLWSLPSLESLHLVDCLLEGRFAEARFLDEPAAALVNYVNIPHVERLHVKLGPLNVRTVYGLPSTLVALEVHAPSSRKHLRASFYALESDFLQRL
jgi:hypothetical protein